MPLQAEDADELTDVLDDERLHEFIGGRPASRLELHDRFVLLAAGSPRPGEKWLNWVVRRRFDSKAVGTVQATVRTLAGKTAARLGWMIGVDWQNQGFGTEAASALVKWVRRQGADDIAANIHPEHRASEAVATRAGLQLTQEEFEGERVWALRNPKEAHMLGNAEIAAIVPVSDVEKAVEYYGGMLGLQLQVRRDDLPENREAEFRAGDGTLVVYESVAAGQSRGTVAGFRVEDVDALVPALRERGVAFEDYDLPDLKTENGIASIGDLRAAWARDPDGNIIAFEQRV